MDLAFVPAMKGRLKVGTPTGRAGRAPRGRRGAWAIGVVAICACAPALRAGADFDPAVELAGPLTFAWDAPDTLPVGDLRLEGNEIVEARVRDAIEHELAERGIRRTESSPDLLVHFHGVVRDRIQVIQSDRDRGYRTSRYGDDDVDVLQYEEGTLVVDVADAETRKVIWRGWAVADVGSALDDQDELTELVNRGVDSMFAFFPVEAATTAP
ncbi:MAG: DUF4136 domain-containing protein [Gemmatimonadales bacterium]